MFKTILYELRAHAPFTLFGTLTGIVIMLISLSTQLSRSIFETLFWVLHPSHVFLSALVTAGMYRLHGPGKLWPTLLIGYFGSVGIGTLSDCVIPYVGEALLDMPNRGLHLGFIEKWWIVNPMAFAGMALAYWRPTTKFPHAGHVLLSTWASLFHMIMALGTGFGFFTVVGIAFFLFLAVWVPCCTSDIVFPLLFAARGEK
ncbi:MAG: hypothetical protein JXL20_06490 [Deltaproteobacteria bacterium]|nr:hypothetical protein [Deltaproteobacteria bacterium]